MRNPVLIVGLLKSILPDYAGDQYVLVGEGREAALGAR